MIHIANPYRDYTDQNKCLIYCPVIVPFEQTFYYINFNIPINDADFNDWRIDLIRFDTKEVVATDIGVLNQQLVDGINYNIYGIINTPLLPVKKYQFVIVNQVTNVIKYISNPMLLYKDCFDRMSAVLEYRNDIKIYNFYYEDIPDFYNKIRVHAFVRDFQPNTTIDTYREVSTSRQENYRLDLDRYWLFEAYKFDDDAHEALYVFSIHRQLKVNGINVTLRNPEAIETNQKKKLNKGTLELRDEDFSITNKKC